MSITDKEFKAISGYNLDLTPGNVDATMKAIGAEKGKSFQVPIEQIHILPNYNPRIDGKKYQAKLAWLRDQIIERGFFQDKPLAGYVVVEDGASAVYVQDGQSRLLAARMAIEAGAPLTHLPMVLKDKASSQLDLTIALVTSNEGEPFGPMEKAALVKRFRAFGKTDSEIAVLMRCTPAYVGQLATLAGAPSKIRNMVVEEEISSTRAIEVIRKHGDKAFDVLQAAMDKAKDKGKAKSSAKDDPVAAQTARYKQFGPDLFAVVKKVLDMKEVVIPKEFFDQLDTLCFKAEQVPAPKAPKEPKPKKVAKAKPAKVEKAKKVPLADKVARASKKNAAVEPDPEAGAEAGVGADAAGAEGAEAALM